jgi:hypothetical protein
MLASDWGRDDVGFEGRLEGDEGAPVMTHDFQVSSSAPVLPHHSADELTGFGAWVRRQATSGAVLLHAIIGLIG